MGTHDDDAYGVLGCPSRADGTAVLTAGGAVATFFVQHAKSLSVNLDATKLYEEGSGDNPRHSDEAKMPVQFIIFADSSGATAGVASPDRIGHWEDSTFAAPAPRHLDTFNAAFLDGHVERGRMDKMYRTEYFAPSGHR